jgi:SAM-dependent methyltransferase
MEKTNLAVKPISELNTFWSAFSTDYSKFDSTMQTFYYSLIHMLDLPKSKHILEVACGTGRLLPLALSLKPIEATYLATDLVQPMVDLSRDRLRSYIEKVGV